MTAWGSSVSESLTNDRLRIICRFLGRTLLGLAAHYLDLPPPKSVPKMPRPQGRGRD